MLLQCCSASVILDHYPKVFPILMLHKHRGSFCQPWSPWAIPCPLKSMESLVWGRIMLVNKGFSDHSPNPFLINLLRKNLYRKTVSQWWAVNKPWLCNSFLPLWLLCVRLEWNGSHSLSLPFCPSQSLYKCHHFSLVFPFWVYLLLSHPVATSSTLLLH